MRGLPLNGRPHRDLLHLRARGVDQGHQRLGLAIRRPRWAARDAYDRVFRRQLQFAPSLFLEHPGTDHALVNPAQDLLHGCEDGVWLVTETNESVRAEERHVGIAQGDDKALRCSRREKARRRIDALPRLRLHIAKRPGSKAALRFNLPSFLANAIEQRTDRRCDVGVRLKPFQLCDEFIGRLLGVSRPAKACRDGYERQRQRAREVRKPATRNAGCMTAKPTAVRPSVHAACMIHDSTPSHWKPSPLCWRGVGCPPPPTHWQSPIENSTTASFTSTWKLASPPLVPWAEPE